MYKRQSVGRVIVNEIVPAEAGYINTIISKKSLRDIISHVIKVCGVADVYKRQGGNTLHGVLKTLGERPEA